MEITYDKNVKTYQYKEGLIRDSQWQACGEAAGRPAGRCRVSRGQQIEASKTSQQSKKIKDMFWFFSREREIPDDDDDDDDDDDPNDQPSINTR